MAIAAVASGLRSAPAAFEPLDIAAERCKGCGLCISVCPQRVLVSETGTVNRLGYHPVRLIDATSCTSCALCARVCPDGVFAVYARPRRD